MKKYEMVVYDHDDCEEYRKNITIDEAIELLDYLEGRWMPNRPSVAYDDRDTCDEHDFELFKACVAVDYAICALKQERERRNAKR